jgi:hypothetical protein
LINQGSSQHRFAASGAEGKTMSFLFIFEQQFRAEKSLLSDRINNELLFINLATVRAERNSISPPAASRTVVGNFGNLLLFFFIVFNFYFKLI